MMEPETATVTFEKRRCWAVLAILPKEARPVFPSPQRILQN